MGVIELVSLAIRAASTVAQVAQARKAERAQREARAVSSAGQEIQDRAARRRAIREARVRQAIIEQSAVSSNATGSSGEIGATSALQANLGSSIANQESQRLTAEGITAANDRAAQAESRFEQIGAFNKVVQKGLSLWDEAKKPLGT